MFANNYVNHEKDRSLEVPDLRHPLKMTYGQRCQLYHNFLLLSAKTQKGINIPPEAL